MGESDAFVHAMIEEDGREGQTWRIGRSCSSWLLGHTSRMQVRGSCETWSTCTVHPTPDPPTFMVFCSSVYYKLWFVVSRSKLGRNDLIGCRIDSDGGEGPYLPFLM